MYQTSTVYILHFRGCIKIISNNSLGLNCGKHKGSAVAGRVLIFLLKHFNCDQVVGRKS